MTKLADILAHINAVEKPIVRLYFTRKTKEGYTTYAPNVSPIIIHDIKDLVEETILLRQEDKIVLFNPVAYLDGTVEECDNSYVGNYDEVLESFRHPDEVDTSLCPEKLTFYCMEIWSGCSVICRLYRRVTKFKKLSSKGLMACFDGDTLNRVEKQMLGLDGLIDVIEYQHKLYVLNHISLERIFRLDEEFSSRAAEALELLRGVQRINNFDQFEEDCLNDHRYHKTLSKMLEENDNLIQAFDNFDNIRQVIEMFSLDIEIIEGDVPRIEYNDKNQRMDILRIINDAYYRSIIRERNGIDKIK